MPRAHQSGPPTGPRRKIVVAVDLPAFTGEAYTTKGSPRLAFDDLTGLLRALLSLCASPPADVIRRCDGTCSWSRLVERSGCGHLGLECAGCGTPWCRCEPWRPTVDEDRPSVTALLELLPSAGSVLGS